MTARTALVTGATRGIGRAIAAQLRARGVRVVGIARQRAEAPVDELHLCDLGDAAATREVLAGLCARQGFDILVNNAGAVAVEPAGSITEEGLQRQWRVNVGAAVDAIQAVLPGMRERRWGRVVSIASGAVLGKAGRSGYSATKAALLGMTRTLAMELGEHGITVNCIAPGQIHTEMWAANNDPASAKTRAMVESIPLRRLGQPEDVAGTAAFLVSDDAAYVTGQTLYVCGGLTVGRSAV